MLDNFPLTLASSTNITKRELSNSDVSHSPPGAKGDFRLGLLPLKMTGIPRTANLISKSTAIFSLSTGLEVLHYLREEFPQRDIDRMILVEEVEQFTRSRGGVIPSTSVLFGDARRGWSCRLQNEFQGSTWQRNRPLPTMTIRATSTNGASHSTAP